MKLMGPEKSTKKLIELARQGDRGAFDELADLHQPRIEALVRQRLGEPLKGVVEPQDIVQETLLRAFRSLAEFEWQGDHSFFGWLAGISNHVVLEQAKRLKFRNAGLLEDDLAGSTTSRATALRREERFDRLEKALESLSPEYREVVLLARVERLPLTEVAEKMGRSHGAVRQLLWRALKDLKAVFGDTESLCLPPRRLKREGGRDGQA